MVVGRVVEGAGRVEVEGEVETWFEESEGEVEKMGVGVGMERSQ